MTISDISTIRVNVWKDMDTDSVGGKTIALGPGATNNGPGDDLGLVTTGSANSYAKATGYKPVFTAQGTLICRVKLPSGATGGQSLIYCGDQNASNVCFGIQGIYWIANGNFCRCRPTNTTNVWETLVGTWGPAGLKGYRNGVLDGTRAYTGTPNTPYYDMSFGALEYNSGIVQNVAMTMDFCAILNRQLSNAEVADLSTTPSQLWSGGGGSSYPPGHAFNNGSGYSGNRRAFVAGGLNLGGF
jgi:hypothetical protein